MNTTTIHPNDLFAPFTPDPDGQSWALTTDADGNILPASHDGPGVAIWCIRIIGERTYAITRQVWDCPSKTVYRGRIWARWFFRLLMSNFENPPKIEWEAAQIPRRYPAALSRRQALTAWSLKCCSRVVDLIPAGSAVTKAEWVELGKAAGYKKSGLYQHIEKAHKRRLVAFRKNDGRFVRVDVGLDKSETP